MPIRITGLNSGLDTEALVSELVSAYRKKTEKYTKARTKLSWKQDKWKTMNSKVKNFYNSLSSLRFSTAYNMKSATVSNAAKASVKAASSAVNGTYSVQIIKTAKSGYLTGGQLAAGTTDKSTLSALGYTGGNGTISVYADGKTTDITVTSATTISEFVDSLNKAGVKASYDATHQRMYVASSTTGTKADFSLSGTDADGMAALAKLGLSVNSAADVANQKAWAAYALNEQGKAYLTFNADGTVTKNGTYDAAATQANIATLLNDMKTASATVTNKKAQIAYANAYKAVNDVDKNLSTDEKDQLKTLLFETKLDDIVIGTDNKIYKKNDDGDYVSQDSSSTTLTASDSIITGGTAGADKLKDLETKAGFTKTDTSGSTPVTSVDDSLVNAYKSNMKSIAAYEGDTVNDAEVTAVKDAYTAGTVDTLVSGLQADADAVQKTLDDNVLLDNPSFTADSVSAKITNASRILDGTTPVIPSAGAVRIDGEDAEIMVNGAKYVSASNDITINGLTITALEETGDSNITVSVNNNSQGLYDKIKGIVKEYNELINEMTKAYNAEYVKGYDPLTTEEKDALSDSEVEEWEKKIKDSLLRRDDTLSSLINMCTTTMLRSFEINGKQYSLSSFGIHTLGILNAEDNEENALHIDGDESDTMVSGNADKLMKALTEDPEAVTGFFQELTDSLYGQIQKKMSSSTMSSFNVVYNDKQMATEYSDYTNTIAKWETKLQEIEDSYYKKFAAMESALAKLNAQQSNLANLLGS